MVSDDSPIRRATLAIFKQEIAPAKVRYKSNPTPENLFFLECEITEYVWRLLRLPIVGSDKYIVRKFCVKLYRDAKGTKANMLKLWKSPKWQLRYVEVAKRLPVHRASSFRNHPNPLRSK